MARRIVDEQHLQRIRIHRRSPGQLGVAWLFLFPNYNLPPRVRITIEGLEHLPKQRRVIFALNHTDRYNYWPFQYKLYRLGYPFTTTWVKAKYYSHPLMAWFFDHCNNIPLPSLGYLIIQNVIHVLGRKPTDDEYRALRDWVEKEESGRNEHTIREQFPELGALLDTPWRDYDPAAEPWNRWMERWNDRVMGLVEQRTLEALHQRDNNVIVFPQGTRSIRLLPAKPGLAEFALRHEIPIVPVGSMGSERVYPGASPWAKRGDILYRIGKPMTVEDRLAPYRIREPYRPFTRDADRFKEQILGASAEITQAINEVLDPPYQLAESDTDTRSRADRLA